MSEIKRGAITHCDHGIDRAYRCIDCLEAALTAERERVARYKDALKKANDLAELMERRWYLLRQAVEENAEEWEGRSQRNRDAGKGEYAMCYGRCAAELRALEKDHAG